MIISLQMSRFAARACGVVAAMVVMSSCAWWDQQEICSVLLKDLVAYSAKYDGLSVAVEGVLDQGHFEDVALVDKEYRVNIDWSIEGDSDGSKSWDRYASWQESNLHGKRVLVVGRFLNDVKGSRSVLHNSLVIYNISFIQLAGASFGQDAFVSCN